MEDTIGKQLLEYRTINALEQKDIAIKLGVTQQAVSAWEAGQMPRPVRVRQIEALIAGLPIPQAIGATTMEARYGRTPEERAKAKLLEEKARAQEVLNREKAREEELLAMEKARELEQQTRREERQMARRKFSEESNEDFVMALPPELTENTHQVTHYDGLPWPISYMSGKICADITAVHPDDHFITADWDVLRIAAIRAMHHARDAASDRYLAIILGADTKDPERPYARRLAVICKALGVELHYVPDAPAAAALIADIEYGPML